MVLSLEYALSTYKLTFSVSLVTEGIYCHEANGQLQSDSNGSFWLRFSLELSLLLSTFICVKNIRLLSNVFAMMMSQT